VRPDLTVIGGGIVGLAVALKATESFPTLTILVLEKEAEVARHQTGHNSGVIHSGIYYKPGSLKAANCVAGAAALVTFCDTHAIPYERCGKVIVATTASEQEALRTLEQRGKANGISGIELISTERLRELEPHCSGREALLVPTAGIVDYSQVARKYAELFVGAGGELRTRSEVTGIRVTSNRVVVATTSGDIETRHVVNCAGLHSDRIMRLAGHSGGPRIVPFRGEYYDVRPERHTLVRNLIYPVPDPRFPFLGVHFTRRVTGGIEAGPNAVLALAREGYRKTDINLKDAIDIAGYAGFWKMARRYWRAGLAEYYRSLHKAAFVRALQKLVPAIQSADLLPGGSGVRAQALDRHGRLVDDFLVIPSPRIIHVCNVPSPAATASLMIGKQIVEMARLTFELGARP
jgi:L-2-hydroxyglutarate oxidase LhgO